MRSVGYLRGGMIAVGGFFSLVSFVAGAQAATATNLGDSDVGIYLDGNGGSFPSFTGEQDVFLISATNTNLGFGAIGANGACGAACVNFSSTDKITLANGGGTIKAGDGSTYSNLTITVPGFKFGDFLFDIQFSGTKDAPADLTILVNYVGGSVSTSLTGLLKDNGVNSFLILDSNTANPDILSIVLTSNYGLEGVLGIDESKHFNISDVTAIGATPLPAALPLFASGIGVLGFVGWRRKRKAAL